MVQTEAEGKRSVTPPNTKDYPVYSSGDETIVKMLSRRVDEINATKVGKDVVEAEIDHLKRDLERIDAQSLEPHECDQAGVLDSMNEHIKDNTDSIKKVYTWQATVGVSLLFFFLTVGVAALRFVDKIDFSTQDHSVRIQKLETAVHEISLSIKKPDDSKKIIKDTIDEYNKDKKANNSTTNVTK